MWINDNNNEKVNFNNHLLIFDLYSELNDKKQKIIIECENGQMGGIEIESVREISSDMLRAKISAHGSLVDNAVTAAQLQEEMEHGELQTCGVFPKEFGSTYGTGAASLTERILLSALPEPKPLPQLSSNFGAAAPGVTPNEPSQDFNALLRPGGMG